MTYPKLGASLRGGGVKTFVTLGVFACVGGREN
jgi:hypothetical protein